MNAFMFTGVIFNVVGAFLALLSLALFQVSIDCISHFHDVFSGYTLNEVIQL